MPQSAETRFCLSPSVVILSNIPVLTKFFCHSFPPRIILFNMVRFSGPSNPDVRIIDEANPLLTSEISDDFINSSILFLIVISSFSICFCICFCICSNSFAAVIFVERMSIFDWFSLVIGLGICFLIKLRTDSNLFRGSLVLRSLVN